MKPDFRKITSLVKELKKDKAPQCIDLSHLQADFIDENGNFRFVDMPDDFAVALRDNFWDLVE